MFRQFFSLAGVLAGIVFSCCPANAQLDPGLGEFNFENPETGKPVTVFYVRADSYRPQDPPVMVLHGMNRSPDEYRDAWIDLAEQHNLFVVVPLFSNEDFPNTVGYNLGNVFKSETDLARNPEATWSYRIPGIVFDYLRNEIGATTADGYMAFGHSAGSQFLHRQVAFAPDERMQLAVAANAGWYTFPDLEEEWPYGFAGTGLAEADLPPFLAANLVILLGDQDTDPNHDSLRVTPEAMRQGEHRFARGQRFYEAGKALADDLGVEFNWRMETVPGVAHDNAGMAPAAARYMAEEMNSHSGTSSIFLQIGAILIIFITIFLIIRRFQTHATLILSGFALLIITYVFSRLSGTPIPGLEESPTGWFGFDLFAIVKERFSSRVATIGMIIMAAGGFARYMSSISASTALVQAAIRPLGRITNAYVLLALAYVTGQILNIFVPSAAGLAMILLVAMYPTLVRLGVRPVAAAAVIGTTACLDLGPASGASNVAATVSGLTPIVYFVKYQLPVAFVVIPVVAVLHFFWQRHCDRTTPESEDERLLAAETGSTEASAAPGFYALLPVLPLILLLVFSPLVVRSIQVDVVTAMLISLFVSMACEAIRLRSLKDALAGIVEFFKGMGDIFAKVVTLIVAAETFAIGVMATGLIDSLIGLVESNNLGGMAMAVVLVLLIGFTAVLTGSGNASLFSFANMIPGIAKPLGLASVYLILPSQLAAGLFRSMSPVAGVIIAVSSAANASPFSIVRRTSVPMLGGVIAMLVAHLIIH